MKAKKTEFIQIVLDTVAKRTFDISFVVQCSMDYQGLQ